MKNNPNPYVKKSDEDLKYVEWNVLMTTDSDPIVFNEKKEFKNLTPEIILKRAVFDTFNVSSANANRVRLRYKTYPVDKNDDAKPFVVNNWVFVSIIDYLYFDIIWECNIQDPTGKLKTKKIKSIHINKAINFFLDLTNLNNS